MTSIISARTALLLELLHGPGDVPGLLARVADRSRRQVKLTPGCSYPMLKELVADGLASAQKVSSVGRRSGGPSVQYTLTARGRELALQQRAGLQALFAESEAA